MMPSPKTSTRDPSPRAPSPSSEILVSPKVPSTTPAEPKETISATKSSNPPTSDEDRSPPETTSNEPPHRPTEVKEEEEQDIDGQDIIDMETFGQILELDDDDDEFSRGMVFAYFDQATQTFADMDQALEKEDLPELSKLGHFLKGSSAALGVSMVMRSCEKIQHYGQRRDEEAGEDLEADVAVQKIERVLEQVKEEYAAAESVLKRRYEENPPEESESTDS